jgi:hypothetical protein
MGSKVAMGLIKKGIKVAGVWYQVEMYIREGPESKYERGCGWGHIENKCCIKPMCGYC